MRKENENDSKEAKGESDGGPVTLPKHSMGGKMGETRQEAHRRCTLKQRRKQMPQHVLSSFSFLLGE